MKLIRNLLSSLIYVMIRMAVRSPDTRILCYHRVNDVNKNYLTVRPSDFEAQMKLLADAGYRTVGLADLLEGTPGPKSVVITFDDGYEDNYLHAFRAMKKYGFAATIFCVAAKVGTPDYLSVAQIQEMRRAGFEFGSHTITHPNLKTISLAEKRREIGDSKAMLEKMLGAGVDYFCYPFGQYDEEAWKIVKESGYKAACCNAPGAAGRIENPYLLKRTEIANTDTLWDFKKKLAGAYDLMHQALHLLRGRP